MRQEGVQTVNETEPVDLCKAFFKQLDLTSELRVPVFRDYDKT